MENDSKSLIEKIQNLNPARDSGDKEEVKGKQISNGVKSDILIFFTPGGWGNISPEKESYAKELLEGVQKTLKDWQYKITLLNYPRAKTGILGKMKSAKEILFSFSSESKKMADLIKDITNNFKNIKIILIGYSLGGAFLNKVMQKIEGERQVYCIQAGTPFFWKRTTSKNILHLDNNGRDALANRNIKKLSFIGVIGVLKLIILFKLIRSRIGEAFHFKEHEYFWENPEMRSTVENFLKNNFWKPYAQNAQEN
jgi:hypothetical protein